MRGYTSILHMSLGSRGIRITGLDVGDLDLTEGWEEDLNNNVLYGWLRERVLECVRRQFAHNRR